MRRTLPLCERTRRKQDKNDLSPPKYRIVLGTRFSAPPSVVNRSGFASASPLPFPMLFSALNSCELGSYDLSWPSKYKLSDLNKVGFSMRL